MNAKPNHLRRGLDAFAAPLAAAGVAVLETTIAVAAFLFDACVWLLEALSLLSPFRLLAATLLLGAASAVLAADPSSVSVRSTATASSTQGLTDADRSARVITQAELAQIWGLTTEELARANVLLKGPRAAFSTSTMSPIEALGIHARSPAERRKYAELLVRIFHQDVERSLVWNQEIRSTFARLYPNEPVVSFEGLPRISGNPSAAGPAHVPLSAINPLPNRAPR